MPTILPFSELASHVSTPRYDRKKIKTRIVHLGFGAFHRAHQAIYANQLAEEFGSDWGYCEVNLIGGEQQIIDLKQQGLLYSVAEMADTGWQCQVVGVVKNALHAEIDGIESVLTAMAEPDVAIVSITVTEKGYCHNPVDGRLNKKHPLIQHDLLHPERPKSVPGVLLAAIRRRREKNLPPFSVMSCDNMPENGHVTRNVVTELAALQDPQWAEWIASHVTFPSTMVDRIVPAMTAETHDKVNAILGVNDPVGIACEPFRQWVIEDNFISGRPSWEKAGADLVADVLPFEEMKLRMLNGSHSFLAYLGYLAGYAHISDCMQQPLLVNAARQLMLNEQAPTLRVKHVDLAQYGESLLERYRNTSLKHRTWQIAMDGTQKLPQRMLDSVRWHLANGSRFDYLALGIAAWMRFVGGIDEQGNPIEINDPLASELKIIAQDNPSSTAHIHALLGLSTVFGHDLPANRAFVDAVSKAYCSLASIGALRTLQQWPQHSGVNHTLIV